MPAMTSTPACLRPRDKPPAPQNRSMAAIADGSELTIITYRLRVATLTATRARGRTRRVVGTLNLGELDDPGRARVVQVSELFHQRAHDGLAEFQRDCVAELALHVRAGAVDLEI